MADLLTCPRCNGEKQLFAFMNGGEDINTHRAGMVDCVTCKGTGQITDAHYWRIIEGQVQRDARMHCGLSLYDAALQRGLTSAQLSAIENGNQETPNDR